MHSPSVPGTARLVSDNVILAAAYLEQVMYNVGWWVQTGDAKQSADTWPKTPHWR
jgi:hypothetical protein